MYPLGYTVTKPKKRQKKPTLPRTIRIKVKEELVEVRLTVDAPIALLQTDEFNEWLNGIVDHQTRAKIDYHLNKIRRGLFGDWKEVDGIYEVRLDFGPGYRLYFGRRGNEIVVIMGGGDKGTQKKDIVTARTWWKDHRDEINEI